MRDIDQPSGQSASLQAMACGKAVVLTRTRGLWEGKYMRDRENCLLVRPNDPEELRKAMGFLADNPAEAERIGRNARRLIEERYTSREFAAMLGRHVEEIFFAGS